MTQVRPPYHLNAETAFWAIYIYKHQLEDGWPESGDRSIVTGVCMTFMTIEKVTESEYVKMWERKIERERERKRRCEDVKM